ncbi:MAG: hypothetical protein PF447_12745, partial [Spirochaetaceae bacterium]|nr:hypothetical protein [Spirochaetaceae bacterium]
MIFAESEMNEQLKLQLAYYPDYHQGFLSEGFSPPQYTSIDPPDSFLSIGEDNGRTLGNGWGNLKMQISYEQSKIYPFLPGDSFLTKDNNVEAQFITSLSPISFNVETHFIMTPLAFLKLDLGGHMGSGWSFGSLVGLGLNENENGIPDNHPFPGLVLMGWMQGTLQFDTAVFWPGDWHHIQFSSSHSINYQHYTAAGFGEAWVYRADDGQNFNGLFYQSNYILGYQMPMKLDFLGFMVESSCNVGPNRELSTIDGNGWGSDFLEIRLGPIAHYSMDNRNKILFLLQFKNAPQYDDNTVFYNYFK